MNVPNKIILTCTITGKTVTWTNKKIIQKKIEQYGSLEAFQAQFTCKGAKKKEKKPSAVAIKPILQQGVEMGKMSQEEYNAKYVDRTYIWPDGTTSRVASPAPVQSNSVV